MITYAKLGRMGRFANGIFQIAGTIGVATKKGYDFSFPYWMNHDHKGQFGSTEDIDVQKWFINPLPLCDDPDRFPERWVHWGFHGFDIPDNHSLCGHFQAPRYFSHCMDLIRFYFKMKDEPEPNDYCAIHYRAGDYENDQAGYHPRCTKEYYWKAMAHFPQQQKYIIFSDSHEEARQMFYGINCTFADGNYLEDFRLMKTCKDFIIANSSYSLMPAILGEHPDKKIVCPSRWFGEVAGINGNDCYPENSIVI